MAGVVDLVGKYAGWPDQWPGRRDGDVFVEYEGMQMPPSFRTALMSKWRGQAFGEKYSFLLNHFFDDLAVFKPKGLGAPAATLKDNICTRGVCKFDNTIKLENGYHSINPGKLVAKVFACS